jgi:hypothetical protein
MTKHSRAMIAAVRAGLLWMGASSSASRPRSASGSVTTVAMRSKSSKHAVWAAAHAAMTSGLWLAYTAPYASSMPATSTPLDRAKMADSSTGPGSHGGGGKSSTRPHGSHGRVAASTGVAPTLPSVRARLAGGGGASPANGGSSDAFSAAPSAPSVASPSAMASADMRSPAATSAAPASAAAVKAASTTTGARTSYTCTGAEARKLAHRAV